MKKETLILLHGALGSKDQMVPLQKLLSDNFKIHTLNLSGHGGSPIHSLFSIDQFTDDLKSYLDKHSINQVNVFGYSMGGYVALNLASKDKRIAKVFTLGTKFNWTPETSSHEVKILNPEKIEEKVPAFAKTLKERHAPQDWKVVLNKTAEMMIGLGKNPVLNTSVLSQVNQPVIISRGTEDIMVSENESMIVAQSIPDCQFKSMDGFKHPIEQVDVQFLATSLIDFFK